MEEHDVTERMTPGVHGVFWQTTTEIQWDPGPGMGVGTAAGCGVWREVHFPAAAP